MYLKKMHQIVKDHNIFVFRYVNAVIEKIEQNKNKKGKIKKGSKKIKHSSKHICKNCW